MKFDSVDLRRSSMHVATIVCPSSPQLTNTSKWARVISAHWMKISVASLCGILFGFVAAASGPAATDPSAQNALAFRLPNALQNSVQVVSTEYQPHTSQDEIARLQTRNRRLEALVDVLRERARKAQTGARARHNPAAVDSDTGQ
jgi:hypothetical protein